MMSIAIGLALAIAIQVLIAYLDNSGSDIEQAEETFGLRVLGVVPRVDVDRQPQAHDDGCA